MSEPMTTTPTPDDTEALAERCPRGECDRGCGFWRNDFMDAGDPCRLIDCGGTIRAVRWVRAEKVTAAQAEGDALRARVEAVLVASDDDAEYEHNNGCQGEAECPACWVQAIRAALAPKADQ